VEKALREAKRNSSWIDPNARYEEAVRAFIGRLLDPRGPVAREMGVFATRITTCGLLTSLAQLTVKVTSPGVPDFYQGTELWDFSMVDPDNRRPVDFAGRARLLDDLRRRCEVDRPALLRDLLETLADGRMKLFMTSALLACRRRERELFAHGQYLPLTVRGPRSDHVVAFARRWQDRIAVTVTARFFARLGGDPSRAPCGEPWEDTLLELPFGGVRGELSDVLSGASRGHDGASMRIADVFGSMPFSVLVGEMPAPRGRGT
jgi:(1->4)-alpha-D-glucan 1-alpha-D-glucosylmutase